MAAGLFRRPSSPALPSLARAPAAASSELLPAGVRGRPARGRISARSAVWRGSGALSALAARPGPRRAAAPVRSGRRRPPASAARGRRVSRSPARARAGAARVSGQRLSARGPQPARSRFYERPRRRQAEVKNRPQGLFPTRRSAFGAIRLVPLLLVHLFVVRARESQITPDFAPAYRKRRSAANLNQLVLPGETEYSAPTPLLTMYFSRQPVATHGNGFRLFLRFWWQRDLRPVATDCNHGAPKGSI